MRHLTHDEVTLGILIILMILILTGHNNTVVNLLGLVIMGFLGISATKKVRERRRRRSR